MLVSRIGLKPITIPSGVEVKVEDNNNVVVKGPKGSLEKVINKDMEININNNEITVARPSDRKNHRSLHGLSRTLIYNMIVGVSEGYTKTLEIVGVGYRAQKQGKVLNLSLGFSHPVEMEDPEGIETEVNNNQIVVKGINKELVGNYAAVIRAWRKPEPYKGKGIRYIDEYVRRKEGKTGK